MTGNQDFGWENMLSVFKDMEKFVPEEEWYDLNFHGKSGQICVDNPRVKWPILDSVTEACVSVGIPKTIDFNTGNNFGVGCF
jgi:choline dehydrogenase-like flavoprotein